jgi:hypothetical protein
MKQVTKIMGARDRKDVNSMVDDSHESIADVTKCNWFEKLPLHWRLLYYFIGGIIIGLLLPYVW